MGRTSRLNSISLLSCATDWALLRTNVIINTQKNLPNTFMDLYPIDYRCFSAMSNGSFLTLYHSKKILSRRQKYFVCSEKWPTSNVVKPTLTPCYQDNKTRHPGSHRRYCADLGGWRWNHCHKIAHFEKRTTGILA